MGKTRWEWAVSVVEAQAHLFELEAEVRLTYGVPCGRVRYVDDAHPSSRPLRSPLLGHRESSMGASADAMHAWAV